MPYLIDTDIIIYSLNGNQTVNERFMQAVKQPKAVSVISYGELVYGARKSSFVEKNMAKVHRVADLFPIINIDKPIIETFGELKAKLSKKGVVVDDMDLIIASTALVLNYTLVTNNEKHFKPIPGLKTENWLK